MVLLSQNVAILESLRTARSYTEQTEALQALKNETVGHVMKKEKWVELGVLRPIVKVILPERPANWAVGDGQDASRSGSSHSRRPSSVTPPDNLPADDLARLQALELLGIFASGGAAFLEPLHAAGALPAILSCFDPNTTHPRLVYAALRSLVTITKAARLISVPASAPSPVTIGSLADTILAAPHLQAFYNIIVAAPRAWWTESITNAAVSLISPLCRETRHQLALAKAGVLDALAVKVASFVVAKGQVVPGAEIAAEKEGLRDAIPEPATPRLDISAVLDAVAAIVGDSRLRAYMLLCAPPILAIFPQLAFDSPVNDVHAAWKALSMGGLSTSDQQMLGALDFLLPAIPSQLPRGHHLSSHNSPFPPLGSTFSRQTSSTDSGGAKRSAGSRHPPGSGPEGGLGALEGYGNEEQESPMVPWLISLVRSTSGLERLMAASVLTSLYKAGFASATRESAMALLVVPLLLRMLDEAVNSASAGTSGNGGGGLSSGGWVGDDDSNKTEHQAITEAALTVLARLVANSDVLQKAAIDGNAIKILARLLKESYEPVSTRSNPRPWNPTPTASANPSRTGTPVAGTHSQNRVGGNGGGGDGSGAHFVDDSGAAAGNDPDGWAMHVASSKLGPAGQSSQLAYRIRLREATLKALTALVAVKYDYQKAFVDQDVMVYVVASLNATPSKPRANKDRTRSIKDMELNSSGTADDDNLDPEYGRNPVGVLVAACNLVRMLSRSIAILRTTLEDAGVAAPIFRLLRHPDIDVQVAVTGVMCNLLTETSPMRERYAEVGVMNILCTHTHSLNSPLRLNALWALKHFVDGLEPSVKKACLEQLGSGWLMQLIDPDSEVDTSPSSVFFSGRADTSYGRASGGMAAAVATPSWSFSTAANDEDVEMDQTGDEHEDSAGASNNAGGDDADVDTDSSWTATATTNQHQPPANAILGSPSFLRARFPTTSHERSRTGRLRQAEAKLAALQEMELAALRKSQNDDVVIQEQGLNFIRNLIGPGSFSNGSGAGPGSSLRLGQPASAAPRDAISEASEMIDYLFSEIGQDRLFQILLSKVRPRARPATSSRLSAARRRPTAGSAALSSGSGNGASSAAAAGAAPGSPPSESAAGTGTGARVQQPRAKIVEAVVFILVHISASVPRHRQVVIAQTELLKALVGQFMNRDKGVRVALCHLVTNLTWRDDQADTHLANVRTLEIKRLGLLAQLEAMQFEDPELDVREQAKMAVHQMAPMTV
ncbi:armadillo repeat protein [Sporothrix brasiliensis 5110]|uniref:Armadillo repeat protein n=1 Tax=Sporothrix brasiliensis 5110 TaxID=1398154 RepID=A0A0C2J3F0_9PEZI|nr:armadillo repeat protein [Sporothrix brasiliensis 5110]KIH91582.1 armadillo repeat protein [Sporothrix brasiliensis 5110]